MDIMKIVGAIVAVTALIVATVGAVVFISAGFVYDKEIGTGGQPKNIDGIEWVFYFGEIREDREEEDGKKEGRVVKPRRAAIRTEEKPQQDKITEIIEEKEPEALEKVKREDETLTHESVKNEIVEKEEISSEENKSRPELARITAIPDAKGINITNESSSEDWEDITMTLITTRTSYEVKIDWLAKGKSHYILNESLQAADGTYFKNGIETFQAMRAYIRIAYGKNKIYYDTYMGV